VLGHFFPEPAKELADQWWAASKSRWWAAIPYQVGRLVTAPARVDEMNDIG
jgi:hypothetical protein